MRKIAIVRNGAAVVLGGMLVVVAPPLIWAACTPGVNPMGVNLTQIVEPPGGYAADRIIEITLRVTAVCTEVYARPDRLQIVQFTPLGWAFDSLLEVAQGTVPDAVPEAGEEGNLSFEWSTPPELPVTATYRLFVPDTERSVQQISGYVAYALGESAYTSDVVVVEAGLAKQNAVLCCGGPPGRENAFLDWATVAAGVMAIVCARRRTARTS